MREGLDQVEVGVGGVCGGGGGGGGSGGWGCGRGVAENSLARRRQETGGRVT